MAVKRVIVISENNMRLRSLFISVLALAVLGIAAYAQNKVVKMVPARPAGFEGKQMFAQFCAACHGEDGRGNGPAASAMKIAPTDLTQLAKRNNGKFDALHLKLIISGQGVAAHGSESMPVWGDVFKSISANGTFADMRINAILKYLQDFQR